MTCINYGRAFTLYVRGESALRDARAYVRRTLEDESLFFDFASAEDAKAALDLAKTAFDCFTGAMRFSDLNSEPHTAARNSAADASRFARFARTFANTEVA